MPFGPNSALRLWQSIRRPPMAAACECWPPLPRTEAVEEVTSSVPWPRATMPGNTEDASRNSAKVASRQPISNALYDVSARPRSPICAPRLNTATSIGPMSDSTAATRDSIAPSSAAFSR